MHRDRDIAASVFLSAMTLVLVKRILFLRSLEGGSNDWVTIGPLCVLPFLTAPLAAVPWTHELLEFLRNPKSIRFGLRTLFTAMTLAVIVFGLAVVLGLALWAGGK